MPISRVRASTLMASVFINASSDGNASAAISTSKITIVELKVCSCSARQEADSYSRKAGYSDTTFCSAAVVAVASASGVRLAISSRSVVALKSRARFCCEVYKVANLALR